MILNKEFLAKGFLQITSLFTFLIITAVICFGQTSSIGTEITEIKIEVKKRIKDLGSTEENISKNKNSSKEKKVNAEKTVLYKSLPVGEVPILEKDEKLIVKFCSTCKSRKFEDLGFKKMLVFFVNPASVYTDFSKNFDNAMKEIEFDFKSKKKKNSDEEFSFDVPYRSIPLIFLVTNGDYKADLKKVILEKQADVIKLGEQSNLLAELPQTIQYLSKVKEVLNTPGALNNSVAESLMQRAQFFKLDTTNCFQQPLITDQQKLSCLSKTFNVAEFEKDLSSLSFDKYGKLIGQEAVSQLRSKYSGMNLFLDATVTVIDLVGTMFKKKPLNIQIAALDTGKISEEGFISLRQIPVNMKSNTERALLLAPLKWRENDAIPTAEMLASIRLTPKISCLQAGENTFLVQTENALVKREIKKISLDLAAKTQPNQKQEFADLPVNPADGSVVVKLDENLWQKMKNWQKISAKATVNYNFETIEKNFELNILPAPNWQLLKKAEFPVRKNGEDSVLRITPNTIKRECLDKIVVADQNKQSVELTLLKGLVVEPSGIIQVKLSPQDKEKFQTGTLALNIYEGGAAKPSGELSVDLYDKQPQFKVSAYLNDLFGEIRGEHLNEIKSVSINGQTAIIEQVNPQNNKPADTGRLKFSRGISAQTTNVSITLNAGDIINQKITLQPPRPRISGNLTCRADGNHSRIIVSRKAAYQPFDLEDCVFPSDTDEIKLILISDGDNYTYSTVNKPVVSVGFSKDENLPGISVNNPSLTAANGNLLTAASSVMSPRRLDVSIKVDQKIREQVEDGNQMFVRINDPVRGESNWYKAEIKFLRLPSNLNLKCEANNLEKLPQSTENPNTESKENLNQKCELSGNLSMIESIFIPDGDAKQTQKSVGLTSERVLFDKLSSEDFLYLKLRGYEPKIKVKAADLQNKQALATPKQ